MTIEQQARAAFEKEFGEDPRVEGEFIAHHYKGVGFLAAYKLLAEDAENYRWLRDQHCNEATLCVVAYPKEAVKLGYYCPFGDRLDAAIKAARTNWHPRPLKQRFPQQALDAPSGQGCLTQRSHRDHD